jgi:probable rRNA maturation factor
MPIIDILVQSPLWREQRSARAVIRRAIAAAANAAPTSQAELAVVLTDDSAIRVLNRNWRGKDAPTNVLSFPSTAPSSAAHRHLGDIVIAYETCAREAQAEGKPFRDHLAHLAVHGFLHLLGYDHITDAQANVMENLEISVLRQMKVPDPYIARAAKG